MNPRRRLLAASLAAASGLPVGAPRAATGTPFTFAVVGDAPYGPLEETLHRRVLESLDLDCAFAIHLGDLKAGDESCDDALLSRRQRLLDSATRLPLVYVPGDNDWYDCSRISNGSHDPLERLQRLRQLFYARPQSLGPRPFGVERQSDRERGVPFVENLQWNWAGVRFVTVNLPGGIDLDSADARLRRSLDQLLAANERWLRDAFARTDLPNLVIALHAEPNFGSGRRRAARDPYAAFRALLAECCTRFEGQVLLLHGDRHLFHYDRPLRRADGTRVDNLWRVECFGSPFASLWVHIRVTPGDPEPYFVNTRQLPPPAPGQ